MDLGDKSKLQARLRESKFFIALVMEDVDLLARAGAPEAGMTMGAIGATLVSPTQRSKRHGRQHYLG